MPGPTESWTTGEAYESLMGRWSRLLAPKFLAAIRMPPEGDALDVGCGTGALSESLLQRMEGQVVGLDASSTYARYALGRLAATKRFSSLVGSATSLPFDHSCFSLVVSSLVLNFLSSPALALNEMMRVCRPQGVVASCVWDYAAGMQFLRAFWDVARSLFPEARELDEGVRFPLCAPKALSRLFEEAGLEQVFTKAVWISTPFRSFDDFWLPFLSGQGPSGALVATLSSHERELLRQGLLERLPRDRKGAVRLRARAWVASGLRP